MKREPAFQHIRPPDAPARRTPPLPAPALAGADYASIELRLLAAGALGRFERGAAGPLLVARPPRGPGGRPVTAGRDTVALPFGRRDVKPDNVPEPFEITCGECSGRGWTQPSMVVGFHPQRCRRCKGSGKVVVR